VKMSEEQQGYGEKRYQAHPGDNWKHRSKATINLTKPKSKERKMLNSLLNALGFGQRIMCNGKPQFVIIQLAENLYVTSEDGAKLPAPLNLSRADLARPPAPPPADKPTDPPGDWKAAAPE